MGLGNPALRTFARDAGLRVGVLFMCARSVLIDAGFGFAAGPEHADVVVAESHVA